MGGWERGAMHRNDLFNHIEANLTFCIFQQVNDVFHAGGRDVAFIEVGANDGVIASKLFPFVARQGWRGLSIEPVPRAFGQLAANYAPHPQVTTLNMAVTDASGALPFYQVASEAPEWCSMLSSFDRQTIAKHANMVPDIERHIQQIEVESAPLSTLCRDHALADLDVLVVDAESHDDIVINTLDFDFYRPSVINFEHRHMSVERLHALDRKLVSLGYTRAILWADTAYLRGALLEDESIQHILRALPTLIPAYDREWGNGNWFDHNG